MASHSLSMPSVPYSRPQTPHPQHQVGFVGLGAMGKHMALNLAQSLAKQDLPLPPLMVYNRTATKAEELAESSQGLIKVCKDLVELGQCCDLIFTSLANDAAAESVYAQLVQGEEKRNGTKEDRHSTFKVVYADTSTLYPETSGKIERMVSSVPGRAYVQAPAFGPPPMAKGGQLVFAVAGPHQSKKFVAQFLVPGMGRKIMDFGSNCETASSFKLIGNSLILSTIEMLSECMTLAEKTGCGAERFSEFVSEFFPAPSAIGYTKKILEQKFLSDEGFSLNGGIKDASHIQRLGASVDCPMPIVDIAMSHLISARANSNGRDLDWSSLVAGQRIAAGLPPFSNKVGLEKWGSTATKGAGDEQKQ